MSAHEDLKRAGIVPTIDAEKAYRLGQDHSKRYVGELLERIARLEQVLTEIKLMAERSTR